MSDADLLLRAVLANPAEDTPRLVYADWLDEHAVERCCDHGGCKQGSVYTGMDGMKWVHCPKCVKGRVSDGRRERAEFIRVQCELAKVSRFEDDYGVCRSCGGDGLSDPPPNHRRCRSCEGTGKAKWREYKRTKEMVVREAELIAAHADRWRHVRDCPECGGGGVFVYPSVNRTNICADCWGSGEVGGLLRKAPVTPEGYGPGGVEREALRVDFERGFPHRVHCRLEDVSHNVRVMGGHPESLYDWQPTPWALAVVRHHPVTQFRVYLPFAQDDYGPRPNSWYRSQLPPFLFDLIQGHDSSTPDAAHTAMAVALAAWVRAFPAGS